jgi:hypothetical protein
MGQSKKLVQVSDTGSFEPFVVIVEIEARLGVKCINLKLGILILIFCTNFEFSCTKPLKQGFHGQHKIFFY